MGSGPSKTVNRSAPKHTHFTQPKLVANVNNEENCQSCAVARSAIEDNNNTFSSSSRIKSQDKNRSDKKAYNNDRQRDKEGTNNDSLMSDSTGVQFEDSDEGINEVLRIPMAVGTSNDKKNRNGKVKEIFDPDGACKGSDKTLTTRRNEDLPETYARSLQRQQYKRQHGQLLQEKTTVHSSSEWKFDHDEDNEHDAGQQQKCFDASKFRAVNKGLDTKKGPFSTVSNELQSSHYPYCHTGQDLSEIDVRKTERESLSRQLPQYNQSEMDLMRQLEAEILSSTHS